MKYRKKPVVIEAKQLTPENEEEVYNWIVHSGGSVLGASGGEHVSLTIHTLEGEMKVSKDDYVIKGVEGEFYPCKPNIFEQTYELVVE